MKRMLILLSLALVALMVEAQEKKRVIIDADTGNEVDDLYAVVRGLIEPSWNVLGLNATQWQVSHWAVGKSMEESYRLNQVLLSYLKMNGQVQSNRGAEARLFDWGNKSQPSTASNFIINEALKTENDKLNVIALGALTNVASAILDNPDIQDKIRLYWLGSSYDFDQNVMKNIDFNSVMDIQAVDVILNSEVELHIIPNSVSSGMIFDWQETDERLRGKHDMLDFLRQRWYNHLDGGRRHRTIWDLALIQAIIFPEFTEEVKIRTSKERGDREVYMYKSIDADRMREEFFETTLKYVEGLGD
ncbi:MAG: nucleoside hydrolase [Candidatus Cyclobacteriaceae bacterium M3_2C_046]